jgi:bifunctional non-homologous end joining protein LigD
MRHRSSSQSRRCWTGYCTTRACGISVEATACRGHEAALYAFDLIEHDGDDLRDLPLIERKRRLARLLGRAKRRSIRFTEHLTGDGPTVFDHVCRMGLEGIVSKRTDASYRSGPSKTWLKSKNPASEAVRREREEEWI